MLLSFLFSPFWKKDLTPLLSNNDFLIACFSLSHSIMKPSKLTLSFPLHEFDTALSVHLFSNGIASPPFLLLLTPPRAFNTDKDDKRGVWKGGKDADQKDMVVPIVVFHSLLLVSFS